MIPAAIANRLWQSTAFAAAAGLLTLAFRANRAQTRHWIWFAASAKFLLPFGLLAALGGLLAAVKPAPRSPVQARVTYAIEEAGAPFSEASPPEARFHPLPGIWIVGCAAILLRWLVRWRRVRGTVRAAAPLAFDIGVPVRSSRTPMEPGVFGVARPVLVAAPAFKVNWTPDPATARNPAENKQSPAAESTSAPSGPSIFAALQQQLGLRLEARKAPAEIVVIDRVERPTGN